MGISSFCRSTLPSRSRCLPDVPTLDANDAARRTASYDDARIATNDDARAATHDDAAWLPAGTIWIAAHDDAAWLPLGTVWTATHDVSDPTGHDDDAAPRTAYVHAATSNDDGSRLAHDGHASTCHGHPCDD